jgi:sterol desaturase/sphingolipid hydroxylase (fatty acid hydroxylase superfamily)
MKMVNFRAGALRTEFPQTLVIPSGAAVLLGALWMQAPPAGRVAGFVFLLGGLGVWTLLEYVIHRFVLHRIDPFRRWHLEHHCQPSVPMRTPLWFSMLLVGALVAIPLLWPTNSYVAASFSCGLIIGYVAHEVVHHRLHQGSPPGGDWLTVRRRHHLHHHDLDEHSAYGTLTDFWDNLFGTNPSRR